MIISKSKGEKISYEDLKAIYGGSCQGECGNCDCTISGGEQFFHIFDVELTAFDTIYWT